MTSYIHILNCIGVLLILSVYQSKISKKLNNRKKVLEIFLQNPIYSHSKIAKLSKVAKSSVGDILRKYKETQTIERKRGGGRKKGFVDKSKVNSIIWSITRNPCQSQRDLAKKFECSRFLVRKALKSEGLNHLTPRKKFRSDQLVEIKSNSPRNEARQTFQPRKFMHY